MRWDGALFVPPYSHINSFSIVRHRLHPTQGSVMAIRSLRIQRRSTRAATMVMLREVVGGTSQHDTSDLKIHGLMLDGGNVRLYSKVFFGSPCPAGPAACHPLKVVALFERSRMGLRARDPPPSLVIAAMVRTTTPQADGDRRLGLPPFLSVRAGHPIRTSDLLQGSSAACHALGIFRHDGQ